MRRNSPFSEKLRQSGEWRVRNPPYDPLHSAAVVTAGLQTAFQYKKASCGIVFASQLIHRPIHCISRKILTASRSTCGSDTNRLGWTTVGEMAGKKPALRIWLQTARIR
ncbi:MAG: hypothetical protein EOL87_18860 [Spartobacteria bacterium]|nr:hypothetical protein [Spartobacteria bacterium]